MSIEKISDALSNIDFGKSFFQRLSFIWSEAQPLIQFRGNFGQLKSSLYIEMQGVIDCNENLLLLDSFRIVDGNSEYSVYPIDTEEIIIDVKDTPLLLFITKETQRKISKATSTN